MKDGKHRKKRCRRWAWIAGGGALTVLLLAGVGWGLLAPYAGAKMDMTLLDIPASAEPAVLLCYPPRERAAGRGERVPAPGCVLSNPARRVPVTYGELPPHLINAFVAIEDKRFRTHRGVDLRRTLWAGLHYLTGHGSFGGSTITQQLVKNLTGRDEQTVDRKLTEIFTALDLERRSDKETILCSYLNIINLSEGCYGVGAAAERYFSKPVSELGLSECAALAAITNNPARYDPLTHPEQNKARRDLILEEMARQGYITEEERREAAESPLALDPTPRADPAPVTSWYADLVVSDVIRDLQAVYGYTYSAASALVYGGGLTVETAQDADLQAVVEAYYADLSHFPTGDGGRPQSGFLLMDPRTGDVLAVAGAIGEKTANRLQSYATDTRRPAGSCIKPLSVYAPALEKGLINWCSIYEDAPLAERRGMPWPANADGLYRGRITVAEAVAESVNTVPIRILEELGAEEAFRFAKENMGLSGLISPGEGESHDGTVSSLALGQQSRGVTLRELTAAYTAFFGGTRREAISYRRVLDREGQVLLENRSEERAYEVLSPETAAIMTRLLTTVTERGTAARYLTHTKAAGLPTAGKTGTTQHACDRRFVGYTPRLLAGVWMGYDYPSELRGIRGNPCVTVWDELIALCESLYDGAPPAEAFALPPTVTEAEYCPLSGCLPGAYCDHPVDGVPTERGWFRENDLPREVCPLHGEPPIRPVPHDPADPNRIPLLPNDVLPPPSKLPPVSLPPRGSEPRGWGPLSRWFSRFTREKER